jgi:hypothetical protein
MVHGLIKKTKKIPHKDLDIAERRANWHKRKAVNFFKKHCHRRAVLTLFLRSEKKPPCRRLGKRKKYGRCETIKMISQLQLYTI